LILAELCSCSVILVSCFVEVIVLPPHAAGDDVLTILLTGFVFSVYATKVDAEQV